MIFRNALGVMLVFTLIIISPTISDAFAENQTGTRVSQIIDWSFENPFVAITMIGFLSLVISLIVLSVGTNIRNIEKKNGEGKKSKFNIDTILDNLDKLKSKLGEPAFTNLLNGLSSAAKEELVFPEPIGVLRHKEFRRALTISVALTYFAMLGFSASNSEAAKSFNDNPLVQAFAWVFVAVIAFYFGDKIFENYAKSKGVLTPKITEAITIEKATLSPDGKKLAVTIRNNLKSELKVSKIYVDGKEIKNFTGIDIKGEESKSPDIDIEKGGKTLKVEAGPVTAEKEIETEETK